MKYVLMAQVEFSTSSNRDKMRQKKKITPGKR